MNKGLNFDCMDLLLPRFKQLAKDKECNIQQLGFIWAVVPRIYGIGIPVRVVTLDIFKIQMWFETDDFNAMEKYIDDCCMLIKDEN